MTGQEFIFPREDELNYSDSAGNESSEDRTYKPTDQYFSDIDGNQVRASRESSKIKSQRNMDEEGIQWKHRFKDSEDDALKVDRGFSDMTDDMKRGG